MRQRQREAAAAKEKEHSLAAQTEALEAVLAQGSAIPDAEAAAATAGAHTHKKGKIDKQKCVRCINLMNE